MNAASLAPRPGRALAPAAEQTVGVMIEGGCTRGAAEPRGRQLPDRIGGRLRHHPARRRGRDPARSAARRRRRDPSRSRRRCRCAIRAPAPPAGRQRRQAGPAGDDLDRPGAAETDRPRRRAFRDAGDGHCGFGPPCGGGCLRRPCDDVAAGRDADGRRPVRRQRRAGRRGSWRAGLRGGCAIAPHARFLRAGGCRRDRLGRARAGDRFDRACSAEGLVRGPAGLRRRPWRPASAGIEVRVAQRRMDRRSPCRRSGSASSPMS